MPDVVVVGGGIVGVSAALFLARAGARVALLERHAIAAGATGRAVGGMRVQLPSAPRVALSRHGIRLHRMLAEELGLDPLVETGTLLLYTTAAGAREATAGLATQRAAGAEVRALSQDEVRDLLPALRVEDVRAAVLSPRDTWADPRRATLAYAEACRRLDVTIIEGAEVTQITVAQGRVTGVVARERRVAAGAVIDAAGAEARGIARMVGVEVPISPRRRQAFVYDGAGVVAPGAPLVMEEEIDFYFSSLADGVVAVRGNSDETFDTTVDWSNEAVTRQALEHRVPALRGRPVIGAWAGLRALSPDGAPLLGPTAVGGFFVAAGFGGQGFTQGPAAGKVLADLITSGRSEIDLTPFAVDRFTPHR